MEVCRGHDLENQEGRRCRLHHLDLERDSLLGILHVCPHCSLEVELPS